MDGIKTIYDVFVNCIRKLTILKYLQKQFHTFKPV